MTTPTAADGHDDQQGASRGACGGSPQDCQPGQTRCGAAPCEGNHSVLTPAVQRVIEWHLQRLGTN